MMGREGGLTARRARRTIGPLAQNRNQPGHPSIFAAVNSSGGVLPLLRAGGIPDPDPEMIGTPTERPGAGLDTVASIAVI